VAGRVEVAVKRIDDDHRKFCAETVQLVL